jgi:predicted secreted hydrolase
MKTVSIITVILLLINPFIVEFSKSFFTNEKSVGIDNFLFSPDDIELKDDAFHSAKTSYFTEWWYFDAIFDNNYSAQMSVRVVSALNHGIIFKRLDIYKDGFIISHNKKSYPMRDFSASKEKPIVYLDDSCVINGFIDNSTGNWVYDLFFQFDDVSAYLRFIGCTKGWKGQLRGDDWWGVSLPRAKTSGTLIIGNKTINVTGIGYHDHNWEVTASAVINFGWYWGKIHSGNYTITWATIMRTRLTDDPILVINKNLDGYLNIEPTKIQFTAENFSFENRHLIPHSFTLIANIDNISINVKMKVINIHHYRFFGFMNYWRYHVKCQGFITVDSHTETIDTFQLAEFIRFR